ncbi:12543_t:CDS:1, partial [Acaulospora colombiana]
TPMIVIQHSKLHQDVPKLTEELVQIIPRRWLPPMLGPRVEIVQGLPHRVCGEHRSGKEYQAHVLGRGGRYAQRVFQLGSEPPRIVRVGDKIEVVAHP